MDELIADLETVAPPERSQFADQMPPFLEMQHFATRCLRRADAEEDGMDPDEVDPTFEAEVAEFRARWPRLYTQDPPDGT